MSDSGTLIENLKGRNVVRAAVAHVIIGWLFVQVADVVLPYLGIVDQPVRWALAISIATFPVTVLLAWLLDQPWKRESAGRVTLEIMAIVLIAVAAGLWVRGNLPEAARTKTNIVILPFAHSGDTEEQGLSRALAYEVMSLLTRSRSIDVIAFESSSSSVLDGLGTVAVANRLNVANVLAGSVSASGERMLIELQLLDAAGKALWEAVIEENISNLFSVQERIATEVETRLGVGEGSVPVATVAAERCWMPTDPATLEQYYTARYYIEMRTETPESQRQIAEAIDIYKKLIADYPEFSEAYAGLAWAQLYQQTYDRENALQNAWEESIRLAGIALEHCSTLGEAMHILPNEYEHENPWISSHQQLTAFIEMEPHKVENYQRLARHYRETGLVQKSLETAERNYALNPLSVRSIRELAQIYLYLEQYDKSSELFERAIELGSTAPNWGEAFKAFDACGLDVDCRMDNLPGPWGMDPYRDQLRIVHRVPTDDAEAQESVDLAMQLFNEEPDQFTNWLNGAACDYEHLEPVFFQVWQGSREARSYWYWPNVWLPHCGGVWSLPEFPAFVESVGLDEYWREVGWPDACQPQGERFACGRNMATELIQ